MTPNVKEVRKKVITNYINLANTRKKRNEKKVYRNKISETSTNNNNLSIKNWKINLLLLSVQKKNQYGKSCELYLV